MTTGLAADHAHSQDFKKMLMIAAFAFDNESVFDSADDAIAFYI